MSGLPSPFDSHFCPNCGEQCDCTTAAISAGPEEEEIVNGCTHVCPGTSEVPAVWTRPEGFTGPCPDCGSTTCPGYYKPDGNHQLAC